MQPLVSPGRTPRIRIRPAWGSGALAALVLWAIPALGQPPAPDPRAAATVEAAVTLVTEALKAKNITAEQKAISKASQSLFDWQSMATQALGREWRVRTPEERTEFVKLFTRLIEQNYLATIRRYHGEKIAYESMVKGGEQVVRMNVATTPPVRIDYRMHAVNQEWRVYDVVIKDSSVVQNYRAQFERILREASYKELVTRIREKTVPGTPVP